MPHLLQALQSQEAGGHGGQQHVCAAEHLPQLRHAHPVHLYKLLCIPLARCLVRLPSQLAVNASFTDLQYVTNLHLSCKVTDAGPGVCMRVRYGVYC